PERCLKGRLVAASDLNRREAAHLRVWMDGQREFVRGYWEPDWRAGLFRKCGRREEDPWQASAVKYRELEQARAEQECLKAPG
ncbi:MAG: hypothetical protein C5B47_03375, partial [Verrucomicrobia bacterium]